MIPARNHFAGVIKIVRFNIRFYALSVLGSLVVIILIVSRRIPISLQFVILCGAAVALFWTLSSLFVSWYVYDYAGVTHLQWLRPSLPGSIHRWANIHAGLDESTSTLRQLLPNTENLVIDIYDSREMTEPSIARARRLHPSNEPFQPAKYSALPLADNAYDAVFILFAAHELRVAEYRTQLLRETARVLRETGHIFLVEHLRDWKNFLAFGPGFFHFHSKRNWLHSVQNAGLLVEQERQVTPFVACFVLRKAQL